MANDGQLQICTGWLKRMARTAQPLQPLCTTASGRLIWKKFQKFIAKYGADLGDWKEENAKQAPFSAV